MNILVVGGAGYIGSHTVNLLKKEGYTPIIYDNLSKGHKEAGEILGVKQLMELLHDEFPKLKFGYFNPPIERIKGNFELDFAH